MSFMLPMHRAEMMSRSRQAHDDGVTEGEQRILREVAKLPSPIEIDGEHGDSISDWVNECGWCGIRWDYQIGLTGSPQIHPKGDGKCLRYRAIVAQEGL